MRRLFFLVSTTLAILTLTESTTGSVKAMWAFVVHNYRITVLVTAMIAVIAGLAIYVIVADRQPIGLDDKGEHPSVSVDTSREGRR